MKIILIYENAKRISTEKIDFLKNWIAISSTGGTRNTAYLFEQQKPKKKHKRRKLTQASKANKLIYKDRKWSSY